MKHLRSRKSNYVRGHHNQVTSSYESKRKVINNYWRTRGFIFSYFPPSSRTISKVLERVFKRHKSPRKQSLKYHTSMRFREMYRPLHRIEIDHTEIDVFIYEDAASLVQRSGENPEISWREQGIPNTLIVDNSEDSFPYSKEGNLKSILSDFKIKYLHNQPNRDEESGKL